jgi:hypothetical protein
MTPLHAFGPVDMTGTHDNTATMQAAANSGQVIEYPAGKLLFSNLTIPAGGIVGQGLTQTVLQPTKQGVDAILVSGGDANRFEHFQMSSLPATGVGINVAPTSVSNVYSSFDKVWLLYFAECLKFTAAQSYTVEACKFQNYSKSGITVENVLGPDANDSFVGGCSFGAGPITTGSGILHYNGGGLKVIGNKFIGGAWGYKLQAQGGNTSILLIQGNSIESMQAGGILLGSGGSLYVNINITGNQIDAVPVCIADDAVGTNRLVIANNNLAASINAINLQSSARFLIGPNYYEGPVGVAIGANANSGTINKSGSYFTNVATPVANAGWGVAVN